MGIRIELNCLAIVGHCIVKFVRLQQVYGTIIKHKRPR
jgi:hypothetical protein